MLEKGDGEGDIEMGGDVKAVENEVPDAAPVPLIEYNYVQPPEMPQINHVPLDFVIQQNEQLLQWQNQIYLNPSNRFSAGAMSVQLDRTFYYPGQFVNGKVFLQIAMPFRCSHIILSCEGKEKCEWERYFWVTEHHTRTVWRDGQRHTEHYTKQVEKHEHEKKKIKPMDFKVPLMDLAPMDHTMNPGNYMASFSFQLPQKISSSFKFENKSVREQPEAKIEHVVKIKLEGTGLEHPPKNKAEIVVRQLPIGIDNLAKKLDKDVKTCGCCSQGMSKTEAVFAGNFYDKNEIAYCQFKVDNTDCKLPIKELKYQFRSQISFHIKKWSYVHNIPIANHTQKGLDKGEKGDF